MIDTHAHLDMNQFDTDREDTIVRATHAGVNIIITVATDLVASQKAIEIAGSHDGIYATVGFHPQDAASMKEEDVVELRNLAGQPKVVAVGEIGLDYYHMTSNRDVQIKALKQQLALASELRLPVVVHSRNADQDMTVLLRRWAGNLASGLIPGVIHCFNGDYSIAKLYLDAGFYIAFGAYIGYPSSKMSEVVRAIPSNRILTETDCPFLPPQIYRGKRNEPAYIPLVVDLLSHFRGESADNMARQTSENARRLFHLP